MVRFLILALLCLFGACHPDGGTVDTPPPIDFSFAEGCDTQPYFEAKGGSVDIEFVSGCEWAVAVSDKWLEVTPVSGTAKNTSFTILCHPNEGGEERNGVVTIYLSNEEQHSIPVRQKFKDIFDIEGEAVYSVAAEGGEVSVDISTNMEYTLKIPSSAQSWISRVESRAMREERVTLAVAENHYFQSRKATISLCDSEDNILHSFTIEQSMAKCDSNEIFYTSTDGEMVDLRTVNGFGATLLSHNYDYGYGRIAFDGDITAIPDNAFNGCATLVTITLPSNLLSIGNYAFENCSSLVNIDIPKSVTTIGNYGFARCAGLSSITFTQSVTTIGARSFVDCSGLTNVSMSAAVSSIGEAAFEGCTKLVSLHIADLESWCRIAFGSATSNPLAYAKYLYEDGGSVERLKIPTSISEVKSYAFYNFDTATEVRLHAGVSRIGISAFSGCSGRLYAEGAIPNGMDEESGAFYGAKFSDVTFGSGVAAIGNYAFAGCSTIEKITLPEGLSRVGNYAFKGCKNLSSISVLRGAKSFGEGAFEGCNDVVKVDIADVASWCSSTFANATSNPLHISGNIVLNGTSVTNLEIPDSVTSISAYTFYNCKKLRGVTLPITVENIGASAFAGCNNLKGITLPSSLKSLGAEAFAGCTGALVVNCNIASVTTAKNGAFYGSMFSTATISEGVQEVGDYALYGCSSLGRITLGRGIKRIGKYAFYGCKGDIEINCAVPSAASEAEGLLYGTDFTNVTLGRSVDSIGGNVFLGYTGTLIVNCDIPSVATASEGAFYGASFTKVVIGNEVKTIGDHAFRGCSKIAELSLGEGLSAIGKYAFANCSSLLSLTLPHSLRTVESGAFHNCNRLVRTEINAEITTLARLAFYGCTGEVVITGDLPSVDASTNSPFYGSLFTQLTIGDAVTTIGRYAFAWSAAIESVVIGEGVKTIESNAFLNCYSLNTLYLYPKTPPAIYYYSSVREEKSIPENEGLKIYIRSSAMDSYKIYVAGAPNVTTAENWFYYKKYFEPFDL